MKDGTCAEPMILDLRLEEDLSRESSETDDEIDGMQ